MYIKDHKLCSIGMITAAKFTHIKLNRIKCNLKKFKVQSVDGEVIFPMNKIV